VQFRWYINVKIKKNLKMTLSSITCLMCDRPVCVCVSWVFALLRVCS